MKTKKMVSLTMIAAMLSASLVSVHSADTAVKGDWNVIPDDWTINLHSADTVDKSQEYIGITENGHSGRGLVLSEGNADGFMDARAAITANIIQGNQYTLSYWFKGTGADMQVLIDNTWNVRYQAPAEDKDGAWHLQTHIFTASTDLSEIILIAENPLNCVIDDFSIKDANGNELVKNGNFERIIYRSRVGHEDNFETNSWYLENMPADMDVREHYAHITDKYEHSNGGHSLHIKYTEPQTPNRFFRLINKLSSSFEAGQEYCLELYIKDGIINPHGIRIGTIWGEGWLGGIDYQIRQMEKGETDENGWTRYSKVFTAGSESKSGQVQFLVEMTNDVLIDDVAIYKTSDPAKTNIVTDGGFENVHPTNFVIDSAYRTTGPTLYEYVNVPSEYRDIYYAEPSARVVHSGTYSMHIRYPHNTVPNRFIQLKQYLPVVCTAGNYTVTFYTYGEYNKYQLHAGIAWGEGFKRADDSVMSHEVQENGWIKHTMTVTVDGDGDDYMNFLIDGKNDVYLDDFSIVKEGTTENLVPDGGFESVEKISYSATRVAAISAGSGAVDLYWTNPYEDVDNIEVYADGDLVSGTYDLSAGYRNSAAITGLENYVSTPVEIVVTANGKEYVTKIDVTADDFGSDYSLGDWRIKRFDPINSSFNIDDEVYAEGKSSMRIDVNYDAWTSNYYPHIVQTVKGLDPTASYTLTFKAKAENIGNFKFIDGNPWIEEVFIRDYGTTAGEKTHDWKEYTCVIGAKSGITTETYDTDFYFCIETGVGSLWLDDMKLYKGITLPNGTQAIDTSVNYIKNGGFEYEKYAIQTPVFSKDGAVINTLETGTIETRVRIKNYTMGDDFKVALIAALYNGTRLVNVSFIEQNITQSVLDGVPSDEAAVTVNVPEMATGEDYELKVMYWDGINTMKSLSDPDELK